MIKTTRSISSIFVLGVLTIYLITSSILAAANTLQEVAAIAAQKNPPKGIVFEIIENKEHDVQWTIHLVNKASNQLRQRFPNLKIVVVSHGNEIFALTKSKRTAYQSIHSLVEQLKRNNIPLQVCGTAASWQNKSAADFPEYVEVVDAAPVKIEFYEDLGYELIDVVKNDLRKSH